MSTDIENKSSIPDKILKEKEFKNSEFIGAIIVNIIILYIVNNLLGWKISFIAPTWTQVLFILNVSIVANILANIGFLIYQRGWFRSLAQIILTIIGFVVAYEFYVVFPFIIQTEWIAIGLKILIILAMVAFVIATIVEVLRLIFINIEKTNS
ncbi:MAG: hypothetical protein FJ150_07820 [Euryarchaeota archaeon]|nr:hypothetical protein [Euryarchaeota archaeon]